MTLSGNILGAMLCLRSACVVVFQRYCLKQVPEFPTRTFRSGLSYPPGRLALSTSHDNSERMPRFCTVGSVGGGSERAQAVEGRGAWAEAWREGQRRRTKPPGNKEKFGRCQCFFSQRSAREETYIWGKAWASGPQVLRKAGGVRLGSGASRTGIHRGDYTSSEPSCFSSPPRRRRRVLSPVSSYPVRPTDRLVKREAGA